MFAIPLYLLLGIFLLLGGVGFAALSATRDDPDILAALFVGLVLAVPGALFVWFAVFLFSSFRDDKPIAIITADEFSGRRWFRWRTFPWTPATQLKSIKNSLAIRNPPDNPTLTEKISEVVMPKHSIGINTGFAAQNHKEIKEAVARLNPYAEDESS